MSEAVEWNRVDIEGKVAMRIGSKKQVNITYMNLPPLVLKARRPVMALPFALDYLGWKCLSRHWVGYT